MNAIQQIIIGVAHGQGGGAGLGSALGGDSNNFSIKDFNFLNLLHPTSSQGAVTTFNGLLGTIISLVLIIAAIVAFFYLIISGFQYITSGGDPAKAQTARQGIINALIGILIIVVSYALLRYVATLV